MAVDGGFISRVPTIVPTGTRRSPLYALSKQIPAMLSPQERGALHEVFMPLQEFFKLLSGRDELWFGGGWSDCDDSIGNEDAHHSSARPS
jgi:hypothetical protein